MFLFLRALRLDPLEWEQAVKLTGKVAPSTLEIVRAGLKEAQAVVVLLTGDDLAQLRPELGHEPPLHQPRPNVFFEAGLALAFGDDDRVILVKTKNLREFSDITGLNYIHLDDSAKHRNALVQRLIAAGCEPDTSGDDYLSSSTGGEFDESLDFDHESSDILYRGGYVNEIIDSAISYTISSVDLYKDALRYIRTAGSVDLKYNYVGALGASNWLSISQDPNYIHAELVNLYKDNIGEIISAAKLDDKTLDYISLGPGDGDIDVAILHRLQESTRLLNYYPLDISLELLQKTVTEVVDCKFLPKTFRIKAIHGDFAELGRYKSIYAFDRSINLFGLIGFSLGNYNEAQLLGKIREGMNPGDLLLLDARLHDFGAGDTALSEEQKNRILSHYSNKMHSRFAFGPVEMLTDAVFERTNILHEVNRHFTCVPAAHNVVVYCKELSAKLRTDMDRKKAGRRVKKDRLDLGVTTVYDADQLENWLLGRGFEIVWKKKKGGTLALVLRKLD